MPDLLTPQQRRRVNDNLRLARWAVGRFAPWLNPGTPAHDDAMIAATGGLIVAAQRFDPDRGVRFASFAVKFCRGALMHWLRRQRQSGMRSAPREGLKVASLDRRLSPDGSTLADALRGREREPDARMDSEAVRATFDCLTPRQEQAVRLATLGDLTRREAAAAMGVSREQVGNLHRAAVARLRERFGTG